MRIGIFHCLKSTSIFWGGIHKVWKTKVQRRMISVLLGLALPLTYHKCSVNETFVK